MCTVATVVAWWRGGWLKALLAAMLGWGLMTWGQHHLHDHTLLHTLVQIEMLRQQQAVAGQSGGVGGSGGAAASGIPSSPPPPVPRILPE